VAVSTAKRHLDELKIIGKVDVEEHRGFNLYDWNKARVKEAEEEVE